MDTTKSSLTEPAPWGVVHESMQDFSLLATAIGMGAAAIRVGFEDSVYYVPGKAAATNAELVEKIVALIHQMGFEVATPEETRQLLGLTKIYGDLSVQGWGKNEKELEARLR